MRYTWDSMLPERAFQRVAGRMTLEGGGKGSSPPPPDYRPMAEATKEGVEASKEMSAIQLAEAKRQYDQNYALAQPIIQAQLASMKAGLQQGEDYYDYMRAQQRPVESALNVESMRDTSSRDAAERALLTGPEADVYAARRADIEDQVGRALADTRRGSARNMDQMIRQGLRYGYSAPAMAARFAPYAQQQGAMEAGIANQARTAGIAQARGLMGQARDLRTQDEARGWAKRLDVAGLYRGLPGASQGAYGLATNAGTQALQSGMAPGQQYMQGMQQGYGTAMQGRGLQMQGLGNILNSQTSMYNAGLQANAAESAAWGQAIGTAGGMAGMAYFSDRRLKKNIVKIGEYIDGINLYEFSYTDDDDARYRGVMADEVESVVPEAVIEGPYGYKMVNYDMLGIKMERV